MSTIYIYIPTGSNVILSGRNILSQIVETNELGKWQGIKEGTPSTHRSVMSGEACRDV